MTPVKVMAIVNISKESIYSFCISLKNIYLRPSRFVSKGADIIDIGARSTFLRQKITLEEKSIG